MKMYAVLFLASLASANTLVDLKTILPGFTPNPSHQARHTLEARQLPTDVADEDCQLALSTIGADTGAPEFPIELLEYMDDYLCITGLPQSLSSESSSFTSAWASWTSAAADEIKSVKGECPSVTREIDLVMNLCKETGMIEEYQEDMDDAAEGVRVVLMGVAVAAMGAVAVVAL